jgi:sarcosine oxidase
LRFCVDSFSFAAFALCNLAPLLSFFPSQRYIVGFYVETTRSMTPYDLIIIGAGAMGSAAAYHAANAGLRVLVLEQFDIDHRYGSSYGYSRIIRYAYTDPTYIALARAVYPMWSALETEAGERLMIKTGGIDYGLPGEGSLQSVLNSLSASGIAHQVMDAAETMRRFPQFRLDDGMIASYQADYGVLRASKCVLAHLRLAMQHGATIYTNTRVASIIPETDSVTVITEDGTAYSAARLVITAGVWARGLLHSLGLDLPLQGLRCHEVYFSPHTDATHYQAGEMPVFIHHDQWHSGAAFYGIPSIDGSGVKIAMHGGDPVMPETGIDYAPSETAIAASRQYAQHFLPLVGEGAWVSARVCLYTMTPDEDFIIDHHPTHHSIVIGSPCSGHGFKFSTLMGKVLVDLAVNGTSPHTIDKFRVTRFA